MTERPLPAITPETRHFWEGARAGELRLEPDLADCVAVWPDVGELEKDLVVDVAVQRLIGHRRQETRGLPDSCDDDCAAVLSAATAAAGAR